MNKNIMANKTFKIVNKRYTAVVSLISFFLALTLLIMLFIFYRSDNASGVINTTSVFIAFSVFLLQMIYIFLPEDKEIKKRIDYSCKNHENLQRLFEVSPMPFFIVHPKDLSILTLNNMAAELMGLSTADAAGQKITDFIQNPQTLNYRLMERIKNNEPVNNLEIVFQNSINNPKTTLLSAKELYFQNENVIVISLVDITEQKKALEAMNRYSTMDELTGMTNRKTGLLMLEKDMEKAKRELLNLSICFLDIDKFKILNNNFGYREGEKITRKTADIILDSIRAEDTVFRFGLDEFIIISDCDTDNFKKILNRIEQNLHIFNQHSSKLYEIEISYGFSEYRISNPKTIEEFINSANQQMYVYKILKNLQEN